MNITCLTLRFTNCYLLETENAFIMIDPGYKREKLLEILREKKGKERLILLTHGHFDHIGGADYLRQETGVKIGIGALDEPALRDEHLNCSDRFRPILPYFSADYTYNDGDVISVGDITLKVMHTPGHTVGGVCYLADGVVFTGDTLFKGSIGRDEFPGGDFETLKKSVKRLYNLDEDTVIYAGHGDSSTIGKEKNENPFVRP